ncbi:protein root UVB sensitive 1, chloroplastic isoform X1, partial [Tanacetum coccineum]
KAPYSGVITHGFVLFSLSPSSTTITPPSLLLPTTTTFPTLFHQWIPLPSPHSPTVTFSGSGGGIFVFQYCYKDFGIEIVTPACPHLFVPIGAAAGAGRSAAALIQAATRSCFYAGFAAQRNFAEQREKPRECDLDPHVLQSQILSIHSTKDFKSLSCLVFGEYRLSGLVPSVKEVNDEEPFFPALPLLSLKPASKAENRVLSPEAKEAAATI